MDLIANIKVFLVFLFSLTMVQCATFRKSLPSIPEEFGNEKGCYIAEVNRVIPYGESTIPNGTCYEIYCSKHYIIYETCSPAQLGEGDNCYTPDYDLMKPYPDCCPVKVCGDSFYEQNAV